MSDLAPQTWNDIGALTRVYYAPPAGRHAGEGWFASLSLLESSELNFCALFGPADEAAASDLLDAIGPDLPVVVMTAAHASAAREVLMDAGFGVGTVPDPLMCLDEPPDVQVASDFHLERCSSAEQVSLALALNAEAHQISPDLLVTATKPAFSDGRATAWLAYDGDEAISTVSMCRLGSVLGVMEMMTPTRHQRRGAGRALLSHVLRAEWDEAIERAVLFSSIAGQHLYESLGFVIADTSITCYRGQDDEALAALGINPP